MKKLWIIISFVLLIAGMAVLLFLNHRKMNSSMTSESASTEEQNMDGYDIITWQGQKYQKNPDIRTLLFLGIDNVAYEHDTIDISNIGRADTIILFLINDMEKSISFLPISRDTICNVDIYDKDDNFVSSGLEQINMQYAYGNTMEHGSVLMTGCVSNLLYHLPVSDYLSLSMDGIAKIVDQMGGIEVTFPQDYLEINEKYKAGETLTLNGSEAEAFIRYRDTSVSGSNNDRMERANCLIRQMFRRFSSQDAKNLLIDLIEKEDAGNEEEAYIMTNVSTEKIKSLASYDLSENIYHIVGDNTVENGHDAFYVDDEQLQNLLIELFYQPIK